MVRRLAVLAFRSVALSVALLCAVFFAVACAPQVAPVAAPTTVVVCPEGSAFDAQRGFCVAGAKPPPVPEPEEVVATVRPPAPVEPQPPQPPQPQVHAGGVAVATATASGPVSVTVGAGGATGLDVRCSFPSGWVSLLPVAAYPRDDSFLMQGLIGLTQDPRFWGKEPEFAKLRAYAARPCSSAGVLFAAPPGDYWVLAGQEGTFSARGAYKNNGVRRKVTVSSSPSHGSVSLTPSDLVHTWLCISCPWLWLGEGEGAVALVVLRGRAGPERRGTERVLVKGVPIVHGKLLLRVAEREREVTHLGALRVEVGGRELLPLQGGGDSALVRGVGVELPRGAEVVAEYAVPERADGFVDVTVTVTGHYDPL